MPLLCCDVGLVSELRLTAGCVLMDLASPAVSGTSVYANGLKSGIMVRHKNLIQSISSLRFSQIYKWSFLLVEQIFTYSKDTILGTQRIPPIPHHYLINSSSFPVTWNKCSIVLWAGMRNLSNSFNLTCGHNDRPMHPPHYPDSSFTRKSYPTKAR